MPRSRARGYTPVVTTPLAPTDFQSRTRSLAPAALGGPTLRLGQLPKRGAFMVRATAKTESSAATAAATRTSASDNTTTVATS
jgi:hypothetical protein